jgi:hypothetical protein
MGLLEDALRETFAAKVATTPTVDDAAGRAIHSGVRLRRRRIALNTLAVMLTIVAVSGSVAALSVSRGRDVMVAPGSSSRPPAAVPPLDVLAGNMILSAEGGVIPLAELPPVTGALRVPDGWLVTTWAEEPGLYHVARTGATTTLVSGTRAAVSPDGSRVAWSFRGEIYLADRRGNETTVVDRTPAPPGLAPVLVTATGGVVLGPRPGAAFGTGHTMWFPAEGSVRDTPLPDARIVAATADGTRLFGIQGITYPCLFRINPVDGTEQHACDLGLTPDTTISAAPDGRYVLAVLPDEVKIFDLNTVWGYQAPVAQWTVPVAAAAWIDGNSLLMGGQGKLLRAYVDNQPRLDEFEVGSAGAPILPIPVAR